jgi:hypothetical protein
MQGPENPGFDDKPAAKQAKTSQDQDKDRS